MIIAISSDDMLFETLVLKGGNALDLVHGLGQRTSLDIDFSMEGEFQNLEDVETRLNNALSDRFESHGYVAFDLNFAARPARPRPGQPDWGGYQADFKIIPKELYKKLGSDLVQLRRNASLVARTSRATCWPTCRASAVTSARFSSTSASTSSCMPSTRPTCCSKWCSVSSGTT